MKNEINALLQAICDDYNSLGSNSYWTPDMLLVDNSREYIKIWTPTIDRHTGNIKHISIWGFLAAVDVPDSNVLHGDILIAETSKAPALKIKEPARGNVFTGYAVKWRGPEMPMPRIMVENET